MEMKERFKKKKTADRENTQDMFFFKLSKTVVEMKKMTGETYGIHVMNVL